HGVFLAFVPLLWLLHPRPPYGVAYLATLTALSVSGVLLSMRDRSDGQRLAIHALGAIGIGMTSAVCGPFLVIPSMATAHILAFTGGAPKRQRPAALALSLGAVLVPYVLARMGIIPRDYGFENGAMTVIPRVTELPESVTLTFLLLAALLTISGLMI